MTPVSTVRPDASSRSGIERDLGEDELAVDPRLPLQPGGCSVRPVQPEQRHVPILVVGVLPKALERLVARVTREHLGFTVPAIPFLITADMVATAAQVVEVEGTRAVERRTADAGHLKVGALLVWLDRAQGLGRRGRLQEA